MRPKVRRDLTHNNIPFSQCAVNRRANGWGRVVWRHLLRLGGGRQGL